MVALGVKRRTVRRATRLAVRDRRMRLSRAGAVPDRETPPTWRAWKAEADFTRADFSEIT